MANVVPGNFRLTPEDDEWPMVFPEGTFKGMLLWADTSLKDDANGVVSEDPQGLRIAILDAAGNTAEPTRHEKVGRKPGDPKAWKRLDIKFKNPTKTGEINITRDGPGTKRISFCLYS